MIARSKILTVNINSYDFRDLQSHSKDIHSMAKNAFQTVNNDTDGSEKLKLVKSSNQRLSKYFNLNIKHLLKLFPSKLVPVFPQILNHLQKIYLNSKVF